MTGNSALCCRALQVQFTAETRGQERGQDKVTEYDIEEGNHWTAMDRGGDDDCFVSEEESDSSVTSPADSNWESPIFPRFRTPPASAQVRRSSAKDFDLAKELL